MAEINDFNVTDASNEDRWPEGMAPSAINNAGRADEGILARWHKDTNGSVASTGSANAYVFAPNRTIAAYYDGLTITFDANFTNTGAATFNLTALAADAIVWPDQTALVAGDIVSGSKVTVRYDGTSWQLVTVSHPSLTLRAEQATTSGTSIEFTGVPSSAKEIVISMRGVSTAGTGGVDIQAGDSSSFVTTGYSGSTGKLDATPTYSTLSSGFTISAEWAATSVVHGHVTLTHEGSNIWAASGIVGFSSAAGIGIVGGSVSLSDTLTRFRLSSVNAFDAGTVSAIVKT